MSESLIESIRAALADGASDDARAAGAAACRTILGVLEAKPDVPIAPATQIATIVHALRGMPVDQLLDLAIAKLRTLVPPNGAAGPRKFAIPMIALPTGRR